jgi:hypothetical protein
MTNICFLWIWRLEVWDQDKCKYGHVPDEGSLSDYVHTCLFLGGYKSANLVPLCFNWGIDSIMGVTNSWPQQNLLTSQSLYFQMPSHWRFGFQQLRWHKHSVHRAEHSGIDNKDTYLTDGPSTYFIGLGCPLRSHHSELPLTSLTFYYLKDTQRLC